MSRWIRSYIDDLSDPKIQNLAPTDHKIWTNVQLVAGLADGDAPGSNGTVRLGDLAFHLRIKEQQLVRRLEVLVAAGLLDRDGGGPAPARLVDAAAQRVTRRRGGSATGGKDRERVLNVTLQSRYRKRLAAVTTALRRAFPKPAASRCRNRSGRDPPLVSGNGSVSHQSGISSSKSGNRRHRLALTLRGRRTTTTCSRN